jgi:hypothetical protein
MAQIRVPAVESVRQAWGSDVPDWVLALAEYCDARKSQRAAGDLIGYSPATVNQLFHAKYPGDLAKIEDKVRGALLGETVSCPVLGPLAKDRCRDNQALPFAATNSTRVRLWRACHGGCANSQIGRGS